eukprot:SM001936S05149  [mRNA]  locus=s1936:1027:1149:- [translate_table: standard]
MQACQSGLLNHVRRCHSLLLCAAALRPWILGPTSPPSSLS